VKQIIKTKEPISLTTYRAGISKEDLKILEKYEDSPKNVLNDLRKQLLEEQGYICCYCMSRIDYPYTKVEHFKSRSMYREKQLDYSNLFIACCGKKIDKKIFYDCKTPKKKYLEKELYCDTKKDDEELNYINLLTNIHNSIKYKRNGLMSSSNSNIDQELNEILNLNYEVLKTNREDALNQLIIELNINNWSIPTLKSNLTKYQTKNSKGKYRPYCEMIVYFLTKKLKQKGELK
jgi:uncharacterized protein (TIGR02646 family)